MSRTRIAVLLALVIALLVTLGWRQFRDDNPSDAVTAEEEDPSGRTSPHPRRGTHPDAVGDITVVAVDANMDPVPDVPLNVADRTVRTNADGRAVFDNLPEGMYPLGVGSGWVVAPTSLQALEGHPEARWVKVAEVCPGPVRVVQDGRPLAGAQVGLSEFDHESKQTTDAAGTASFADRPCTGWAWIADTSQNRERSLGRYEVRGEEVLVLEVSRPADVRMRLVNADREPVTGGTFHNFEVESLGEGVFRTVSPTPVATVVVSAPGYAVTEAFVPADGVVHDIVLQAARTVRIHAMCDPAGCPAPLVCDGSPCEGTGPTYTCACMDGTAPSDLSLAGQPDALAQVAPAVDEANVDLRQATARIMGRWAGPMPCGGMASSAGSTSSSMAYPLTCETDGKFYTPGMLPAGSWTFYLNGGEGTLAAGEVTLAQGEQRDIGTITPDAGRVHGRIDADFPLDGALVFVVGTGSIDHLEGGQDFELVVRDPAAPVQLTLRSPDYGVFTRTFPSGEGTLVWTVSWDGNRDGLAEPRASDASDEPG